MTVRRRWAAAAVLLIVLSGAERLPAQSPAGGGTAAVAVVGQITQPGAYAISGSRQPLTRVLMRAGGLTRSATGNIRIIRNGRGGMQTFIPRHTPPPPFEVVAGDVIVCERDDQYFDAAVDARHVAIVNLTPHPVVVPVRGDYTNLAGLLRTLGQSPAALTTAQIISRQGRTIAGSTALELASGDCIVLNRGLVRPPIVRFPAPYPETHNATPRIQPAPLPDETAGTSLTPVTPPSVSRHNMSLADRLATPGRLTDPEETREPARSEPRTADVEKPAAPRLEIGDNADIADAAASPAPESQPQPAAPAMPAAPGTDTAEVVDSTPEPASGLSRAAQPETKPLRLRSLSQTQSGIFVLFYAAGVAVLMAAVLIWKMLRATTEPRSKSAQTVQPPLNSLERLVRNELPLREEPVQLPESISLQGRPADDRILRWDAPHGLAGPHGPLHPNNQGALPLDDDDSGDSDRQPVPAGEPMTVSAGSAPPSTGPVPDRPAAMLPTHSPTHSIHPPHAQRPRGRTAGPHFSAGVLDRALQQVQETRS